MRLIARSARFPGTPDVNERKDTAPYRNRCLP